MTGDINNPLISHCLLFTIGQLLTCSNGEGAKNIEGGLYIEYEFGDERIMLQLGRPLCEVTRFSAETNSSLFVTFHTQLLNISENDVSSHEQMNKYQMNKYHHSAFPPAFTRHWLIPRWWLNFAYKMNIYTHLLAETKTSLVSKCLMTCTLLIYPNTLFTVTAEGSWYRVQQNTSSSVC